MRLPSISRAVKVIDGERFPGLQCDECGGFSFDPDRMFCDDHKRTCSFWEQKPVSDPNDDDHEKPPWGDASPV